MDNTQDPFEAMNQLGMLLGLGSENMPKIISEPPKASIRDIENFKQTLFYQDVWGEEGLLKRTERHLLERLRHRAPYSEVIAVQAQLEVLERVISFPENAIEDIQSLDKTKEGV